MMETPVSPTSNEELKKLLEESLKYNQETHKLIKKIKRYLVLQSITGLIYFILIVLPIILGIIYLPQLLGGILPGNLDFSSDQSAPNSYLQEFLNKIKSQN